jgi:hypothetical protein
METNSHPNPQSDQVLEVEEKHHLIISIMVAIALCELQLY